VTESSGRTVGWQYDALYQPYTPSQAYRALGSASGIGPYGVLASEYNLIEKFNVLRGLMDTFTVLYPQLQELDFRRDVTRLAVPVYIHQLRRKLGNGFIRNVRGLGYCVGDAAGSTA